MGAVVAKVAEVSPENESLRIIAFKIRLRHLCLSAGVEEENEKQVKSKEGLRRSGLALGNFI